MYFFKVNVLTAPLTSMVMASWIKRKCACTQFFSIFEATPSSFLYGDCTYSPFDIDGDGLLDQEEVRAVLLRYYGNCTYYVRVSACG